MRYVLALTLFAAFYGGCVVAFLLMCARAPTAPDDQED